MLAILNELSKHHDPATNTFDLDASYCADEGPHAGGGWQLFQALEGFSSQPPRNGMLSHASKPTQITPTSYALSLSTRFILCTMSVVLSWKGLSRERFGGWNRRTSL